MDRRQFLASSSAALTGALTTRLFAAESNGQQIHTNQIVVNTNQLLRPLPHYWETCFGSDRTAIGLRDQWRKDLIRVRRETGMQSVRCHGLFDDEMEIGRAHV